MKFRTACYCALPMVWICVASAQNSAGPTISPGGIVNAASFALQPSPLAPGSIVSIFGVNLAPSTLGASGFPLPTTLNGTTVNFTTGTATYKAPLILVSQGQINAQIPFEVTAGTVTVTAVTAAGASAAVGVQITAVAPALFTAGGAGYGPIAGTHANNSAITAANPAKPGEVVVLYGTGFGAVQPAVASGAAAGGAAATRGPVTVTVGGRPAPVGYAGVTPGFAGLYQVNVTLPSAYQPGDVVALSQAANAQGAGRMNGNPVLLGNPPADGNPTLLAFPSALQTLGAQVFLGNFPTFFLAFDGAGPCYTSVNFFVLQPSTAGVNRPIPSAINCVGRGVVDQLAIPAAANQPANPPRLLFPTFSTGGAETAATGFLSVDPAANISTPVPIPTGLSGDSYDASFLNTFGTNMYAPGRNSNGNGGAGMLVLTNTVQMHSIASPSGTSLDSGAQFFGGNQLALDNTAQLLYATAGASASGPFFNLVAMNLRNNTSSSIPPPPGLSASSPQRYRFDLAATPPTVYSVSSDGTAAAPAYNLRIYDLQGLTAVAVALPASVTPAVSNTVPVYFFNATSSVIEIPTVSAANPQTVTGFQTIDQVRRTPKAVPLPPGITDVSEVAAVGDLLCGLMNSTAAGGGSGFGCFDPTNGNFTLWTLPKGLTSVGRGQAGKSVQAPAQARNYLYLTERRVFVAPASKNTDPTISDAGLAVFAADGTSSLIALPSQVARVHATGALFYKPETNRVYALGDASTRNTLPDVLVWFDLGTGASGALSLPSGALGIVGVTYSTATGFAIGTANNAAKADVLWQLP